MSKEKELEELTEIITTSCKEHNRHINLGIKEAVQDIMKRDYHKTAPQDAGSPSARLEGIARYAIEACLCTGLEAIAPETFLIEDHKRLSKNPPLERVDEKKLTELIQEINFESYGFSHEEVAAKTAYVIRTKLGQMRVLSGKEIDKILEKHHVYETLAVHFTEIPKVRGELAMAIHTAQQALNEEE